MQTRQNTLIKTKFLAIDGLDGSGKATCSKEIAKFLSSKGKDVLVVDFPQYEGPWGKVLTHLLTKSDEGLNLKERMCVYALNRLESVDAILKEGPTQVIFDRYPTSNVITFAYYLLKENRKFNLSEFKEIYKYMWKIENDFQKLLGNIRTKTNVYILEIEIEETMKRLYEDKKRTGIQLYEKEDIQRLSNDLFRELSKLDKTVKIISQKEKNKSLQKKEVAMKIIKREFPGLLSSTNAEGKGKIKHFTISPSPDLSPKVIDSMEKLFLEFTPSHFRKLQKIAK